MELMDHQKDAIAQLGNGKILYGGVGSGKSATALGYYVERESPKDIVVITTAKKRDSLDWQREAARFGIGGTRDSTLHGTLTVDSWNNIRQYRESSETFFIFDEQRLVGTGVWVRSFLKIARSNRWILLSATPGDTWLDYAPVFIANGWYRNISDFKMQHVKYAPYVKFPKVDYYLGTDKLERLRHNVLVEMPFINHTNRVMNYMDCSYDRELWDKVVKKRWNVYEDCPIRDVAELFRVMRRVANSDPSRLEMVKKLMKSHPRLPIFYNFNFELEILRTLGSIRTVAEWNGHKHEPIPDTDEWVYLVQYVSGSEAWECTSTDALCMYSLTYSYKSFRQSLGRIDRLNTKFVDLFYYILKSDAPIDTAIQKALNSKESFNERKALKIVDSW